MLDWQQKPGQPHTSVKNFLDKRGMLIKLSIHLILRYKRTLIQWLIWLILLLQALAGSHRNSGLCLVTSLPIQLPVCSLGKQLKIAQRFERYTNVGMQNKLLAPGFGSTHSWQFRPFGSEPIDGMSFCFSSL